MIKYNKSVTVMSKFIHILLVFMLLSCIGEDIVPDEQRDQESLTIGTGIRQFEVNTTFDFTADYINKNNAIEQVGLTWSSTNTAVASFSNASDGSAQFNGVGETDIVVAFETLTDSITISVINTSSNGDSDMDDDSGVAAERIATFQGDNGYRVSGRAALRESSGGTITLELLDDFSSQNGPDLFVYLTNSDSRVDQGLNLGELKSTSGPDTYAIPAGTNLNTYSYVLIYCARATASFGFGQFE